MDPEDQNFGFGLFDDSPENELHPLQIDEYEDGDAEDQKLKNIYRPIKEGTELHRAIKMNNQSLINTLLNSYQADFDKISDYLVKKYNWDPSNRIWLKKVNLIAVDEEQCRECKQLERNAPVNNELNESIFVVLKCPLDEENVAVLHPNANNRLDTFQLVRKLLPNGFLSWNYTESKVSETFIEKAASCGRNEIIKRLLELGADLNLADHNPLIPACLSLQMHTIRWLLNNYFDDFDCTMRNSYQNYYIMNPFLILMQKNSLNILDFVLMKMINYRQKYYNETKTDAFKNIFHFENKDLSSLSSLTFLRTGQMQKKIEEYILQYQLDLSYNWENISILVCLMRKKMALDYCCEEIRKNPQLLGITVYGETTVLHECVRMGMLDILSEMYVNHPKVKLYFENDRGFRCLNEVLYSKRIESVVFILDNHAEFFIKNLDKLKEEVVLGNWRDNEFYEAHGEVLAKYFPMLAQEIAEAKQREPIFYPGHDLKPAFNKFNLRFEEHSVHSIHSMIPLSNIQGMNGIMLLHYAVDKDNTSLFINLLEAGCDIDVIDNDGNHPIHYVRSVEMLLLIIEKHSEGTSLIHRTNFEGYSVLHKVCSLRMDQKQLIVLLEKVIELGADVNQLTKNGDSAVFLICSCTVLEILRKYNVNLEVVNSAGETALDRHLRSKNNCVATVLMGLTHEREFFKDHAHKCLEPFMYLNRDFFSCDYQPFLEKNPRATKLIFDSVYNHSREIASRLFCKACGSAHIFITEKFLEFDYYLDYDYQDNESYTPIIGLLSYMEEPNGHLVRMLLKKGVDLEIRNQCGRNALLTLVNRFRFAKWYGHGIESVQLLLDHGALVSSTDDDGNTALHYAFRDHEWELVGLLMQNGADLSKTNKDGKIPLQMANTMQKQLFSFMH